MKRSEIMALLKRSMRTEETVTRVYLGHLDAIAERADLTEEQLAELRRMVEHLIRENQRHLGVLQGLKARVESEGGDDF